MILLAIETSSAACSVALFQDGVITENAHIESRAHGQKLLPMLDSLLKQTQITFSMLNGIVFGRGPGSFTGVRIAASATQAIAFAHNLPVIPISSLLIRAQHAHDLYDIKCGWIAVNAGMGEYYFARCEIGTDGLMNFIGQEEQCQKANFLNMFEQQLEINSPPDILLGDIFEEYKSDSLLQNFRCDDQCLPQASAAVKLGARLFAKGFFVTAEEALPVYSL